MGGSALSVFTRRYNKDEFEELYKEIFCKLFELVKGEALIGCLPAYRNKQDFGDMDILVEKGSYMVNDLKGKLKDLFNYQEIYCNGNVWSFDYKELQIDLIFTKPDCWVTSLTYYAWNDLGNLMGRVANKLGVKYGHKGLEKKIYSLDRARVLDEILITKDPESIFNFLGYDYSRFKEGFDTLEEIFNYAVSSKYFTKELFYLENLDHANRTRNRKRKTYIAFLEWLNVKDLPVNEIDFSSEANWERLKDHFPEIGWDERLQELREEEQKSIAVKKKFNGNIVREITGLDGKELGGFITAFKKKIEEQVSFEYWVLHAPQQIIEMAIRYFVIYFKK